MTSAKQSLDLDFATGTADAVAGTYQVKYLRLLARGEPHKGWGLSGSFGEEAPKLTVREKESVRLVAGGPLTVTAQATAKDAEGTIDFRLVITGLGGETYRWRQRSSSSPKAGFEIVDAESQTVAAEEFEYG